MTFIRPRLFLALSALFVPYSAALAGETAVPLQCQNVRLNAPLGPDQEVPGFQVALDGTERVLFLSDVVLDEEFDALTVPQDGSAPPTLFDIDRIPGRFLNGLPKLAIPTSRVVIVGDFETLDQDEIFSVSTATGGGPLTRLNPSMVEGGDIRAFAISPDGTTVAYAADQEVDQKIELYRVDIDGGNVTKLSDPADASADVDRRFEISSDSRYVVFRVDGTSFRTNLFSADLTTGDRVQLNENPDDRGSVSSDVLISPDGATVVYRADQESNLLELFAVPIAGGTAVKISGPEITNSARDPVISADSGQVVYLEPIQQNLYSVPIVGGTPVNLTESNSPDSVREFVLSGDRVVYEAFIDGAQRIFTVPIAGGPLIQLSGDPNTIGTTDEFVVSPDSQQIAYAAVSTGGVGPGFRVVRAVSIDGSNDRPITGQGVPGGDIRTFEITPDNQQLVFSGDFLIDGQRELFAVSLNVPGPVRRINSPLPDGAAVGASFNDDFQQTLDGMRVVYLADQNTQGVKELFSADIRCDDLFADGFE
ncbi:MAG: hypothetical protein AAF358_10125 [Pseudomonadota bacterium]